MMLRIVTFIALLLTALPRVDAQPVPENDMKATYLYNFALYTEWPSEVGDEIHLCVMSEDQFHDAVHVVHGRNVNGRRLMVRHIVPGDNIDDCQMLYLGENEAKYSQRMLDRASGLPILTIIEGTIPLYSGVMISLMVEDRRLAFQINASAARRSKLNISSKLLRLARIVY